MDIDHVIAREQIRDLVSRYNANGDSGRFERVRELFCPDATMQIGRGRTYDGLDEIMTIFTESQKKRSKLQKMQ